MQGSPARCKQKEPIKNQY